MFLSPTCLPHLLAPGDYYRPERCAAEMALIQRSWQVVGTTAELSRDGDFITTQIGGVSIQLRNFNGSIRALSNVCCHRHCLISSQRAGRSSRMRCQYHGWEFQADGRTGRIPEPKNFVPFDREKLCLPTYKVETLGQLVWVNLDNHAADLQHTLGEETYRFLQSRFDHTWSLTLNWSPDYPANWKVPIENSLEAYHVPAVHPHTFKVDPGEDKSEHLLLPHRTAFAAKLPFSPHSRLDAVFQQLEGRIVRALGHADTRGYSQHHLFPNLLFSFTDAMSLCHCIMPIGPTESRAVVRQFGRLPTASRAAAGPLAWLWGRLTAALNKHILKEDLSMFRSIQQGLQQSSHTGVLGRCEERIHAFQHYLQQVLPTIEGST